MAITALVSTFDVRASAALEVADALAKLETTADGLSGEEAARRLAEVGPNAVARKHTTALEVFARQLKNPLLPILMAASLVSFWIGTKVDAVLILVMVGISIALGFMNEYRSEQAVEALHTQVRHRTIVMRGGHLGPVDVLDLVPGDVVRLSVGDVVPADLRFLATDGLECDEAVLTGEALPVEKNPAPVTDPAGPLELPPCAFMGTIVRAGTGTGLVVATGGRTELGKIAEHLSEVNPETSFQRGLRDFSKLLVRVTLALCGGILVVNLLLHRPPLEAALFSLAIAVGLTPEFLPAIVTISLSTGAQRMAHKQVLVRRLVAIEDFGNVDVLLTDKTGTLTTGTITFRSSVGAGGGEDPAVLLDALLCSDAMLEDGRPVGGSPLDQALWLVPDLPHEELAASHVLDVAPFDYERRRISVLVQGPDGMRVVTKGAPESVFEVCGETPQTVSAILDREFDAGSRVVAVAARSAAPGTTRVGPEDEHDLTFEGFVTFEDPAKPEASAALGRLARLGIEVKIVTGDNERVAVKVCGDLRLEVGTVVTGKELDLLDDAALAAVLPDTTIFARVSPEQKSRVIRAQRALGNDVAYMGDGVNDAVALHDADVGISVEDATDVAKDAADILLLQKDLAILADGVAEGRRVFANTIKYILMATSSNFGNMFSAAGASLFLPFLPMLPTQILLNNLLYDMSQTAIPTDEVDEELLARPSHWDMRFIRRFMGFFGPISSIFDFLTFGVMLWVFQATQEQFHTGWFIESLATQTLVIFIIRTRRVPFWRSRPSRTQTIATLTCATLGVAIPYVPPLARLLGFSPLPPDFLLIVLVMIAAYLTLVEFGTIVFYRHLAPGAPPLAKPKPVRERRVERVAMRWTRPSAARRRHKKTDVTPGPVEP